jgi:hypothetical protein
MAELWFFFHSESLDTLKLTTLLDPSTQPNDETVGSIAVAARKVSQN